MKLVSMLHKKKKSIKEGGDVFNSINNESLYHFKQLFIAHGKINMKFEINNNYY